MTWEGDPAGSCQVLLAGIPPPLPHTHSSQAWGVEWGEGLPGAAQEGEDSYTPTFISFALSNKKGARLIDWS